MRGRIARIICIACFGVSLLLIMFLSFRRFSERSSAGIIGGADIPTFMFALRQTLCSPVGIIICGAAALSLIVLLVLFIKEKKNSKR